MARAAGWWAKQVYLALIPAYPVGYLVVHGLRGEQFWTKPYVERSVFPPTETLKDLVESELDKIGDIKKAKVSSINSIGRIPPRATRTHRDFDERREKRGRHRSL